MTGVRFTIFCSMSSLALSPALAQQEEDRFDLGTIVLKGELVVEGRPNENLNLLGSLGYARTKFTDFNNADVNFDGNQFAGAPEWTGAVGASHGWNNAVTLAVDASHTGARNGSRTSMDAAYVVQLFYGGTQGRVGERRTVGTSLTRSF